MEFLRAPKQRRARAKSAAKQDLTGQYNESNLTSHLVPKRAITPMMYEFLQPPPAFFTRAIVRSRTFFSRFAEAEMQDAWHPKPSIARADLPRFVPPFFFFFVNFHIYRVSLNWRPLFIQ